MKKSDIYSIVETHDTINKIQDCIEVIDKADKSKLPVNVISELIDSKSLLENEFLNYMSLLEKQISYYLNAELVETFRKIYN